MRLPYPRPASLALGLLPVTLLLGGLLFTSGCGGPDDVAINEDTVDFVPNNFPTLTFATIDVRTGSVIVCFTLRDNQSNPTDITPEYSLDGGLTFREATELLGAPSEGVVALPTSPDGIGHCYVWNTMADGVGRTQPTTVIFRMTPFDNMDAGPPTDSGPFTVFNPDVLVDIGTDSGLFGSTGLTVPVTMNSTGAQPGRLIVTVQFDPAILASSVPPADVGPTGMAAGAMLMTSGAGPGTIVLDIVAPNPIANGVIANLLFDSITPAATAPLSTPVTCISVEAFEVSNAVIGADCGTSGSVFLFPNMPPTCGISSPMEADVFSTLGGFMGTVQVGYSLADAESDIVNIAVDFSTDGGATWAPATELMAPPSEGTMGLATSPTGVNHIFSWDADADIPGLTMMSSPALLRITATDAMSGATGVPCLSGNFTVDLRNAPPSCVQPLTVTGNASNITITFDIDDVEMDMADISFEYESPAGSGFVPATPAGISLLPNPSLSVPTPNMGLVFIWDSLTDLGAVVTDANFRITLGDAFNPLIPPAPNLVSCTNDMPFPIDNTACVFQSLRVLAPGSALGAGTNTVGGGPTAGDPCTVNDNYTFSLGGPNMGELTDIVEFRGGGNPLVFSDAGQTLSVVCEGTFSGVCAGMMDVTLSTNMFGMTTYTVNPGPGGPYVMSLGDGQFMSLATAPVAQSGCDVIDVTFTPNGMGMAGGSNGTPDTRTFVACVDYFGWDDASRNGGGLLPVGALDGNMPGTPSGEVLPGAGGRFHVAFYGQTNPMDVPSAFDIELAYDPTFFMPDTTFGVNGAMGCIAEMWTVTPNPMFMGMNIFLANGFRISTDMGSSEILTMAFTNVSAGGSGIVGTQNEWADASATTIPGPQPLPWVNPGMSSGFTLP